MEAAIPSGLQSSNVMQVNGGSEFRFTVRLDLPLKIQQLQGSRGRLKRTNSGDYSCGYRFIITFKPISGNSDQLRARQARTSAVCDQVIEQQCHLRTTGDNRDVGLRTVSGGTLP